VAEGADFVVLARIVDEASTKPVSGVGFEVKDPSGKSLTAGKTDWQGLVRHGVTQAGTYTIAVTSLPEGAAPPPPPPAAAPGAAPAAPPPPLPSKPVPAKPSGAAGAPLDIPVKQRGAFVISVVVTAIGGVPLAEHEVRIIDPATKAHVGDPVKTDAEGWLTAVVPENKPYDLEVVEAPDEAAPGADAPEDEFDGQEECEVTLEGEV